MKPGRVGNERADERATPDCAVFANAPPHGLLVRWRPAKARQENVALRVTAAILVAWVPLAVLAFLQGNLVRAGGGFAFLSDAGVHARFLAAVPLFIVAEAICVPQLSAIARHFADADLVTERDRPRFDAAIASTRTLVESMPAQIGAVVLAYGAVVTLIYSVPTGNLPAWHRASGGASSSFSPAGWWHALVSLPLLLVLVLGWAWRLCLWTRFLWLMSRLHLRLIPVHPDRAAGLMFVTQSVRAFTVLALALGTIVAGTVANAVLKNPAALIAHKYFIGGAIIVVVGVLTAPLLVFTGTLIRQWQRGMFEYGALADRFGRQFERKWLRRETRVTEDALRVPDFSAATDLYQTVSNVYAIRFVPVDLGSVVLLVGGVLLPFVPVVLMAVPSDEVLAAFKKLLF